MDHFVWDDTYKTGDQKIDQEHKRIFSAANILQKAIDQKSEGAILDKAMLMLLEYTTLHFDREITFFKSIGCSDIDEHRQAHQELVDEIVLLRKSYGQVSDEDLTRQLELWMVKRLLPHIKESDVDVLKSAR